MIAGFVVIWALLLSAGFALALKSNRPNLGTVLPIGGILAFVVFASVAPPLRLLASTYLLLILMKAWAVADRPRPKLSPFDWLIFWFVWPGFDSESFERRSEPSASTSDFFKSGLKWAITGVCALLGTAYFWSSIPEWLGPWFAIFELLMIIHFGVSGLMLGTLRMMKRPVEPLFVFPFQSQTLMEFWTRRWNMAFVEMGRRLFQPRLSKLVGRKASIFGLFAISGILHELAISYPSGGGYGLPFLYFVITVIGVLIERKLKIRSKLWTTAWILIPLPLLFTDAFRQTFIAPMMNWAHQTLHTYPLETYLGLLLWVLPLAQLVVLGASFQVPKRLEWATDLQQLNPFNRKLMWVYGGFIASCIVFFALMTLILHSEFLVGGKTQAVLASFMCLFWVQRLLVDRFYFKHDDWPQGLDMQVGHALLNALFVFLAISYGLTAAWSIAQLNQ